MFRYRFFTSPPRMRREMLAADAFAPVPVHPAVEQQLASLIDCAHFPIPVIRKPWGLFLYTLRSVKQLVVETVLWNVLAALVVLASVLVTREVIKEQTSFSYGIGLALGYLVLRLCQAYVEYGNNTRRLQIHRGVQTSLYNVMNAKLLRYDASKAEAFSKGQQKTLIGSDVEAVEDFISAAINQWVSTFTAMVVLVPAIALFAGYAGFIALGVAMAVIPLAAVGAKAIAALQARSQKEQDTLTTIVGEWVTQIRLVRYLGWDAAMEQDVFQRMRRFVAYSSLRHILIIVVFALSMSWSMMPLLALLWIGAHGLDASFGLAATFSTYWLLEHLMSLVQYLPHSLTLYGAAVASAERIIAFLKVPEIHPYMDGRSPGTTNGLWECVHFADVTVQFGQSVALSLPDLTLSLRERTAVVGEVGSGKTLLVELLTGELHPSGGTITLRASDGTECSLWHKEAYDSYRAQVAYVPQQAFLSNTTLRNNIDLSGAASIEAIERAAGAAQLSEDVKQFSRGYDEEVGELGINLSGGQKQRVSLSRAFLSERPFLVLDDPLSAVDPETEGRLVDAIFAHTAGLVMVSHRLGELSRCDRVVVLDRGAVVEDGDPKVLREEPGSRFNDFLNAVEQHG